MNQRAIKLLAVCLLLGQGLASCVSLAPLELVTGMPQPAGVQVVAEQSKDGPLKTAKFRSFSAVDTDQDGNVYILDGSLIRKISTDGQVTTLIGPTDQPEAQPLVPIRLIYQLEFSQYNPLILSTNMEVIDHSLYFTNWGCLLRFDLKQTTEPKVEVVMGKCISPEDAERAVAKETGFKPGVHKHFSIRLSDTLGNLYFGFSENNKGFEFVLNKQGEIKPLPKFFGARFQAADSKGNFYWNREGMPGPGHPGPRSTQVYTVDGQAGASIAGEDQLDSPWLFTIDSQDYLYWVDRGEIKRLSPTGKLQPLAQLKDAQDTNNLGNRYRMAVNPQRSILYVADSEALYQIRLPQNPQ